MIGRLEGKVDRVLVEQQNIKDMAANNDSRIRQLEKDRAMVYGSAAVLAFFSIISGAPCVFIRPCLTMSASRPPIDRRVMKCAFTMGVPMLVAVFVERGYVAFFSTASIVINVKMINDGT